MKRKLFKTLLGACLVLVGTFRSFGQVNVSQSNDIDCTHPSSTLSATFAGDDPIPSGIHIDDRYPDTPLPIGFTFNFYGNDYTQCLIGPNGTISFNTSLADMSVTWVATGPLLGQAPVFNSVCGPWCDIDISPSFPASGTITYSTTGVAPNRKFIVTFCKTHMYSCTEQITSSQMILYETSNIVETHIGHKDICSDWYGATPGLATIGVQNADGTAATAAPGRDFAVFTCDHEAWRFAPNSTFSAYACTSIPYAPVPYASSALYWYNATTGAYLGTGPTMVVTPTVPTQYKVGAIGCSDTSFAYITLTPSIGITIGTGDDPGAPVAFASQNPTTCGNLNGKFSLLNLTPGLLDTVDYTKDGVAQPALMLTVAPTGTITVAGAIGGANITQGVYNNIVVHQQGCISNSVGPITLSDPPLTITADPGNPTTCGGTDGTLTLHGLYPSQTFVINYTANGVAQPPLTLGADASGALVLPGLSADIIYDAITATFSAGCVSSTTGPYTLVNPGISISDVVITPPTVCGAFNGALTLNGLYAGHVFTINYTKDGVAQAPVSVVTDAAGSATLSGLAEGSTYTAITASFGTCITPPMGPYTLTGPPMPDANIITIVSPTECGRCNGSIVIKAVIPFSSDTIGYTFGAAPMPAFPTVANGDSTIHLNGLCAGTYSNLSVKIGHCPITVNGVAILSNPEIAANETHTVRESCHGDSVLFVNGSANFGSTGTLHYLWSFGDGSSDSATNPLHIYSAGTYTLHLTTTNNYCNVYDSAVITVGHPLKAVFTETPDILCLGQTAVTTNTSVGATAYQWLLGDGTMDASSNTSYTYTAAGTYNLQLIASRANLGTTTYCYDTAYKTIYVDPVSAVSVALTDSALCAGTDVTFTASPTTIGNTGITWVFDDGDSVVNENPVRHGYTNPGVHTVTANAYFRACATTSASRTVAVLSQPSIDLGKDFSICKGSESMNITDAVNSGNPLATWVWSTGGTGNGITVVSPGLYYATVNINNCYASDSVEVSNDCYISIPNAFTPNGDGINDYFFPRQYLSKGLITFKMQIYNRWGQLIFESTSTEGSGWDGKLNGVTQESGVYVYIMDAAFRDGQKQHHQGNVTLLR